MTTVLIHQIGDEGWLPDGFKTVFGGRRGQAVITRVDEDYSAILIEPHIMGIETTGEVHQTWQ